MMKKFTSFIILIFFLALFRADAQNIQNIIGPTATCPSVPVRYRVIFNPTCSAPSIIDIRKYNQNEGPGNLAAVQYIGNGRLSTGEFYEDFDLTFTINLGQNPAGGGIGIVFQSTCSGTNSELKGLIVDLRPPPTVTITPDDGSFILPTRCWGSGCRLGISGSKTLTASVDNFVLSYKWTISGNTFSISGPDDQATVTVVSTSGDVDFGTLTLRVATGTCNPVYANYSIEAVFQPLAAATDITTRKSAGSNKLAQDAKVDPIEVKIYGNPVTNNLVAKVINHRLHDIAIKSIQIYDANMRLLSTHRDYISNSTINLDVSNLSNGVYFLKIVTDHEKTRLIRKFVVQR